MRHCAELCGCAGPHSAAKCLVTCKEQCFIKGCSSIFCSFLDFLKNSLYKKCQSGVFLAKMKKILLNASSFFFSPLIQLRYNEPVFLVSEFSLRYLMIFEDQILVLDFSSRYQKKNSQMILRPEDKAQYSLVPSPNT